MHTGLYRAPVYEPTVDELTILKKLELGEDVSLGVAAKEHMAKRLLERGFAVQDESRHWHITDTGRMLIRRTP
ncbi:hypothetical protein KUF54_03015 [Comamonas sp. Y33R10-2]|uniref:hypothetical protein n=1 Tax=Comamonas sp. Y33R10-2 TaxID=2853257 RepID=UPI001C5CB457|nr:hypothetical protein [Comamonas sp. Y33R10-2]QXZ10248.1 hypothetical protein KUF54_03015 [Comamonas sp. Y33R10-2]